MDRTVLPSCQGSGIEAWGLLHERYKPVTSGGMIGELRELILKTNLFIGDDIEPAIFEWERKLQRFTSACKMQFPSQLLFMLLLQGAPEELQRHVCLTIPPSEPEPFPRAREFVINFIKQRRTFDPSFNPHVVPMEIGAITRGKGKGKRHE